jgi:hypothetical protein
MAGATNLRGKRMARETFLMSHVRDLESRLRNDTSDIETQIPFWEFLDIEFDQSAKRFYLTAHYAQSPPFQRYSRA